MHNICLFVLNEIKIFTCEVNKNIKLLVHTFFLDSVIII